jgi:A/G-specific adenine glycosylase
MKKLSLEIMVEYGGRIHDKKEDLLKLSGVGHYTAGAVRVFGFGLKDSMVDSNVVRVLSRVFLESQRSSESRRDKEIISLSEMVTPPEGYKEFWWGVLDFGALVCKAINPKCEKCPLRDECSFYVCNRGF